MGVQLNEDRRYAINLTISPSSVAANTTAEQTFTITGLKAGDLIEQVNKPSQQAGLGIVNTRVTAANTIGIAFCNVTGSPITPTAAETYTVLVFRPEKSYTAIPS